MLLNLVCAMMGFIGLRNVGGKLEFKYVFLLSVGILYTYFLKPLGVSESCPWGMKKLKLIDLVLCLASGLQGLPVSFCPM